MKEKNKINKKKIVIAIVAIIGIIYILYVATLLHEDENDTFFIEQGTMHKEETVVGYVIRSETVIKGEEYQNGIVQIAGEGEKVAKDEPIFQYYNNETKELTQKISEIDFEIQETLKTEKITLTSNIKLIETQIEDKIENLRNLNNTQEITEYNKEIDDLLEKKIVALGEITTTSDGLKQLVRERNSYRDQIKSMTEYIIAPTSGIVSYRVDGLEETLTPQRFNDLNREYLENLNLKTGQMVATSTEAGKVIDNFKYYIAVPMDSEESISAKQGDKVKLRLSTNDEIKAEVVHINEETENRILIFEIDRLTEKLINYRKISFDIIWSSDSGFKVPNKAIAKDENGLAYIIRTRSGYLTKLLVKIVSNNENYSIVTTYSSEELTNLGYSEEEISDYKKLKLYDEILLHPNLKKVK